MRILVLYCHNGPISTLRTATLHHLQTLNQAKSRHKVLFFNALTPPPSWFKTIRFDAIVLDTTFLCLRWSPFFDRWKRYFRWIGDCTCTKIALPQDEYDHSEVLDEWLNEMQVSALFSCFPAETCHVLYPTMHRKAALYKCFTGYIHASTAERIAGRLLPIKHREKDIIYRARHLPYWFGRHGQLKHQIAAVVGGG